MSEAYRPVDCGFHDLLEDAAVCGRTCGIRFRGDDDATHEATTTILDVFSSEGAEWARLGTGTIVRLDRLDEVEPMDPRPSEAEGRGWPA